MNSIDHYRNQSIFSDPGEFAPWLVTLLPDLPTLHHAANQLVFHYSQRDQFAQLGIAEDRLREIDTRYADEMFRLVQALDGSPLGTPREPARRMLGCCRDYTLFLVAMARHHGIPARSRVGFATYFIPGWFGDHVVAEIWDASRNCWRLVDANLDAGYTNPGDGHILNVLDLPRDRFLTAPNAWQRCRSGDADPERFRVDPDLDEPYLRSWPYLIHNLLTDLAALNRQEVILWDTWGLSDPEATVGPEQLAILDALAVDLSSEQMDANSVVSWSAHDVLRVPNPVTTWSPATPGESRLVELRT